ncbi:Ig-like domain-containing protein [Arenibacter sp. GZD96]|uniref:Ig-like domain-containing protein n=1 Tax=Aurantibrevibacter litoralis TaxID=3106030 RepID=UPI002AFDE4D3|nr:Ig-like domain-containing protein [Arenibacter sp. GZD-96]MEA1787618.1 Ig-like domain-containing protein [Arenibacter sp. GZD-96]
MMPHPTKISTVILFFIFCVLQFSCQKDTDLFAELRPSEAQDAVSIRNLVLNDYFLASPGQPVVLPVLENDTFDPVDEVTITETTTPENGTVTINQDNTVTYTPQSDTATDSFDYTTEVVSPDNTVTTAQGTVTVVITDGGKGTIQLNRLKAFPSAQGHGADKVTGGKGGKIFYVTSTANNESGSFDSKTKTHSGTFRYAMNHPDPGYIIFKVSGAFTFGGNTEYYVSGSGKGNKTIMGGTAPYPGVILYGHQFRIQGARDGNWIIRGLTFLGGTKLEAGVFDAFNYKGQGELVLSDNTFGWGADEAYSIADSDNFVVQRNFAIEGHPNHNVGSIFNVDTSVPGNRGGSVHDNGYVHLSHRFPNVSGLETDFIDIVNQFAYNYSQRLESHKFQINLNDINNYYKKGPRSSSSPTKKWNADDSGSSLWKPLPQIHTSGNFITGRLESATADNKVLWEQHISSKGFTSGAALPANFFVNTMHPLGLDIQIKTAQAAYEYNIVGKNIGARYYMDANGQRAKYIHPFINAYFEDAIKGTATAYRNDQSKFVLPSLPQAAAPYEDADHDGMADAWERVHGLIVGVDDKESKKDLWVIDGYTFVNNGGYTNIQMFDDYVHGGLKILGDQQ